MGVVDKSGAFAPTYPQFMVRNLDLRSSCESDKVMCCFYTFEWSMLTDKSKEDCFTALNLKTVLGDFLRTKLGL